MGVGGGREGRELHVSLETPERYYNYFTRTGIIKTETDASPGEKQAPRNVLPLTLKTLFRRADSFADFWRKFRVPFIFAASTSPGFVAQGAGKDEEILIETGKMRNARGN